MLSGRISRHLKDLCSPTRKVRCLNASILCFDLRSKMRRIGTTGKSSLMKAMIDPKSRASFGQGAADLQKVLFAKRVKDIVGRYLNPREHALVLSVYEKSQVPAMKIVWSLALALLLCGAQARAQARKPEVVVQAGHADVVMSVAFSPDGRVCATGSRDTTIKLWDTRTGHLLRTLVGHTGRVTKLVFSSDSQALVSESKAGTSNAESDADNTDRLWQVQTSKLLVTTEIGPHALSPDGALYGACDEDGLKLWDAHTGRLVHTVAQASPLATLAFSPDSRLLAASTDVRTLDYLSSAAELEPKLKEKAPPPKARDKEAERPEVWEARTGRALFKLDAC